MGSMDPIQYRKAQETSIPWFDSSTIRYLFLSLIGQILLQLVPMLQARSVDWWVLGSATTANVAAILIKMSSPTIQAPGPVDSGLNKGIYPAAPK